MYEIKKFSEVEEGDEIMTPDGSFQKVVRAYEEHIPETMYEVTGENNKTIKASGNHLWYVITSYDKEYHRHRVRKCKKLFKSITEDKIEKLLEIINKEEEIETSLIDIISLLEIETNDKNSINALVRIAESIGPISDNQIMVDYLDEGQELVNSVPGYDAKLFAQQILALTGLRKFKKQWEIKVGRVITTEKMFELSDSFEIHIPDSNFDNIRN